MKLFNPTTIVVHHSASRRNQHLDNFLVATSKLHKKKMHPEANGLGNHIAYHYVIGEDGSWEQTRPLDEVGYHAGKWLTNLVSIGICLIGNFEREHPSQAQLESLEAIVTELRNEFGIKKVISHKDVKATACPGKNLSNDVIQEAINRPRQQYEDRLLQLGVITSRKDMDKPVTWEVVAKITASLHDKLDEKIKKSLKIS